MFKRKKETRESMVIKEKVLKINSTWPRKIARVIVWSMVAFLMLRGIGTLFYSDDSVDIAKQIDEVKNAVVDRFKIEMQASAFAENFIYEYLTYKSTERNEHSERISKYFLSSLDERGIEYIQGQAVVQEATAISVSWYSDVQLSIDVKAKIKYLLRTPAAEPDKPMIEQEKTRDVYIRVPIRSVKGKYVVEDVPMFISEPAPVKAIAKYELYSGETVENTDNIKEMLSNFIKTYYEGSESEILYYLANPENIITGMNGAFIYKSLDSLKVYQGSAENEYLALVGFTIADPISNQAIKQRMHITLENKETRYYIKQFDARVGNLIKSNKEEN